MIGEGPLLFPVVCGLMVIGACPGERDAGWGDDGTALFVRLPGIQELDEQLPGDLRESDHRVVGVARFHRRDRAGGTEDGDRPRYVRPPSVVAFLPSAGRPCGRALEVGAGIKVVPTPTAWGIDTEVATLVVEGSGLPHLVEVADLIGDALLPGDVAISRPRTGLPPC